MRGAVGPKLTGGKADAPPRPRLPLAMIVFWLGPHNSTAVTTVAATIDSVSDALVSSLLLGLGGAATTMVLALPLGMLAARHDGWLVTILERLASLSQGVPAIVVALALVTLTLGYAEPLYQTSSLLVIAYATRWWPSFDRLILQLRGRVRPVRCAGRSKWLRILTTYRQTSSPQWNLTACEATSRYTCAAVMARGRRASRA